MQTDRARYLAVSIVRSITPLTGALLAGLCVVVPLFAAGIAENKFGRPSSTSGLIFPFALISGVLAAALGAALGGAVAHRVRTSRWAGPVDWRTASIVLISVVTTLTTVAVGSVFRIERLNTPRVIASTGAVVRSAGAPADGGAVSATLLWESGSLPDQPLEWNGRRVLIEVTDDALQVRVGDQALPPVDLAGLSYVREVYGVTARLGNGASESLVLLARLRATGRRELLAIFDPQGTVAHLELLERPRGRVPPTFLWTEGHAPYPQVIGVNLGIPLRYTAAATRREPLPAR